jgi:hypothetical protein
LLAQGNDRRYVWMPLSAASVIGPTKKAIRIESPAGQPAEPHLHPSKDRRMSSMAEPITNGRGKAAKNGRAATIGLSTMNGHVSSDAANDLDSSSSTTKQNILGLIDQAEILRTVLRDALEKNNELLASLKRRRRQNRMVQQTIAQLQNLKTLGD